ncbi:Lipoprotein LpqB beta-propeller domain-containing protein [Nakamurella panacisegetis]|uniref:Lipoprotein LpqB beta-propeller domain-containing protein n=1 Tax=Nakamurella panacisegetis TaxID=1090615 RepID=A0A1H0I6R0_9ACTN|nr:LpqB family beta-propeller domain-containing protein [Nakamurella panacisegetis]SDO27144.1 Lipoprotein LpqB beta-propeller domain-containing protein [Nakamurella panacisegetis]
MRSRTRLLLMGAVAVLLVGCSGIPGSSAVHAVSRVADQVSESAPAPPIPGSGPGVIVSSFIQAAARVSSTGAVGSVFDAPAQYLTAKARADWKTNPPSTVQILSNQKVIPGDNGTVVITGTSEGTLDTDKAYRPGNGLDIKVTLHLVQESGQWRISDPPTALLILQSDFNRVYAARTVYFLDASRTVVVPDRRYLITGTTRNRVATLVNLLLAGPAGLLKGAAQSELDQGSLRTAVTIDQRGIAHVDLLGIDLPKPADQAALAAQIVWTLNPDVAQVMIAVNGVLLSDSAYTRQALESFSPDRVPGTGQVVSDPYYVDRNHRVVDLLTGAPMSGSFGSGAARVVSAAMSAGTGMVAGVSDPAGGAGQTLLIGRYDGGTPQSALRAKTLTQPTFNRTGDEVWVVQNGTTAPEIYQVSTSLTGAAGLPSRAKVGVSGLEGRTVTGLTLSPDGIRVAIVADGQLFMGAIASSTTAGKADSTAPAPADGPDTLSVINLQPIRSQLGQVGSVVFSSATELLAVGRESGSGLGFRSITSLDVDGSNAIQLTSTGLNNDVQSLAVNTASGSAVGPGDTTTTTDTDTTSAAASMYVVSAQAPGEAGTISALSGSQTSGEWVGPARVSGDGTALSVFFPH